MLHQLFCVGRMTKLKNDEVAPRLIFMAWGCVLLLIKNMAGVFPLLSFFQFTVSADDKMKENAEEKM